MEKTGGEPDVVGHDQKTPETPKKRLLRPGRPGKEEKKGADFVGKPREVIGGTPAETLR